jgi:hypothetical protein
MASTPLEGDTVGARMKHQSNGGYPHAPLGCCSQVTVFDGKLMRKDLGFGNKQLQNVKDGSEVKVQSSIYIVGPLQARGQGASA